jgi:SHS2 domain-containing protein
MTLPPQSEVTVRVLDHTADTGLEVEGPSLAAIVEGAARGMIELLVEDPSAGGSDTSSRTLQVSGAEPALLLRNVLRELLHLHATEGFVWEACRVSIRESDHGLAAECVIDGRGEGGPPLTEIKGVTLHGLVADFDEDGRWLARVIFDL